MALTLGLRLGIIPRSRSHNSLLGAFKNVVHVFVVAVCFTQRIKTLAPAPLLEQWLFKKVVFRCSFGENKRADLLDGRTLEHIFRTKRTGKVETIL